MPPVKTARYFFRYRALVTALFFGGLAASLSAQSNHPVAVTNAETIAPAVSAPQFRTLGSNTLAIGQVTVHKRERKLTFPAKVNMDRDLIEYAVVTEAGSTHESLLATSASPRDIHMAALLLGVKPSPGLGDEGKAIEVDRNAAVDVQVIWKADGQECRHKLSQLVTISLTPSNRVAATLTNIAWLYTGSRVDDGKFVAETYGNIISLIRDPMALLNNPGDTRDNDEVHLPNARLVPKVGTPVTVELRFGPPPDAKPEASLRRPAAPH
jgi:hypothetical protein